MRSAHTHADGELLRSDAPFGLCATFARSHSRTHSARRAWVSRTRQVVRPDSGVHLISFGVLGFWVKHPLGRAPLSCAHFWLCAPPRVPGSTHPSGCAPRSFNARLRSGGASGFLGEAHFGSRLFLVRTLLVVRAAPCFGVDAPFGLCAPFLLSHRRALAAPRAWV